MNKKGFTLVELLGVIVILAIIILIAGYSIMGITHNIHKGMVETKINSIETAAIEYGQENANEFINFNEPSNFDIKKKIPDDISNHANYGVIITVQDLIDKGYFTTEETDSEGNRIVINNLTNESMNNEEVLAYRRNNRVYAYFLNRDTILQG